MAYRYLLIIFLGIPFTLLYNLEAAMLRAVGDSKTPFVFLAISTMTNILLDLLCILVFVPIYGYTAICCADQVAWTAAVMYLIPMCLHLLKKVEREVGKRM